MKRNVKKKAYSPTTRSPQVTADQTNGTNRLNQQRVNGVSKPGSATIKVKPEPLFANYPPPDAAVVDIIIPKFVNIGANMCRVSLQTQSEASSSLALFVILDKRDTYLLQHYPLQPRRDSRSGRIFIMATVKPTPQFPEGRCLFGDIIMNRDQTCEEQVRHINRDFVDFRRENLHISNRVIVTLDDSDTDRDDSSVTSTVEYGDINSERRATLYPPPYVAEADIPRIRKLGGTCESIVKSSSCEQTQSPTHIILFDSCDLRFLMWYPLSVQTMKNSKRLCVYAACKRKQEGDAIDKRPFVDVITERDKACENVAEHVNGNALDFRRENLIVPGRAAANIVEKLAAAAEAVRIMTRESQPLANPRFARYPPILIPQTKVPEILLETGYHTVVRLVGNNGLAFRLILNSRNAHLIQHYRLRVKKDESTGVVRVLAMFGNIENRQSCHFGDIVMDRDVMCETEATHVEGRMPLDYSEENLKITNRTYAAQKTINTAVAKYRRALKDLEVAKKREEREKAKAKRAAAEAEEFQKKLARMRSDDPKFEQRWRLMTVGKGKGVVFDEKEQVWSTYFVDADTLKNRRFDQWVEYLGFEKAKKQAIENRIALENEWNQHYPKPDSESDDLYEECYDDILFENRHNTK